MKIKRKSGFTLAEMMLTVAIIVVLLGVAFIAFMRQQRTMTRLEYDTIAKEIFVAAQNHLTSAQSQGYLQLDSSKYGTKGDFSEDTVNGETVVWYAINNDSSSDVLNLMLPNYAVDGAVLSGSYIIRYQPSAGLVLDVFYSREQRLSYLTMTGTTLGTSDYSYSSLMTNCRGDDKISTRNSYGNKNAVIGWYGNEKPVDRGERLAVPSFEIINAEQLLVKVNDPNLKSDGTPLDYASLKLIVIGKKSGAEKYFPLVKDGSPVTGTSSEGNIYSVILDDITTKGMHFADIMHSPDIGTFVPGEDLTVKVVVYSNTRLANIAMSDEKETNSLFADPDSDLTNTSVDGSNIANGIAAIANIRHLENLDKDVSAFIPADVTIAPIEAKQITDLSWTDFMKKTDGTKTVIQYTGANTEAGAGYYYPVSPAYKLEYDGQNYAVSEIAVSTDGAAGMFGSVAVTGSKLENLKLIDFDIKGGANAGALVGTATGATVTNVLAYHTDKSDYQKTSVSASSGDAGGLIGKADACAVSKSAAALVVNASANAGGLIGSTANDGSVTACYSGGHTYSGPASAADPKYDDAHKNVYPVRYYDASGDPLYNVTGPTAGGLIGSAGTTTVSGSYSTCSASGKTAGGFVGTAAGPITNCYCTGLVSGTSKEGAFAASATSVSACQFFEIINERKKTDAGYSYLQPLGNTETTTGVTAFDENADTYDSFVGGKAAWKNAVPYDKDGTDNYGLKAFYKDEEGNPVYNLQTVEQLNQKADETSRVTIAATDFVTTHYGDWPAPEEFIFN